MKAASVAVTVFVVLVVVFTAAREFSVGAILGAAVSALAFVVGAYFAPAGYTKDIQIFTLRGDARWEKIKSIQLIAGAVAAGAAALLFLENPGAAALLGIVIALLLGAFGPSLVPAKGESTADRRA